MRFYRELVKGLWAEIPVFRVLLGLCPTLAVTTTVENGLGMGLAASFVLVCSNMVISSLRRLIPDKVRIPCFIVVVATFVTIVDLMMNGFAHSLHKSLGIFIPLIVVNCIILGRAEAFAARHGVWLSLADGIGMGLGFTIALVTVAAVRELSGSGSLTIWGSMAFHVPHYPPVLLMVLAPGGFITLGCLLGLMNRIETALAARAGRAYTAPTLDCRHCVICAWGGGPGAPREPDPQEKAR